MTVSVIALYMQIGGQRSDVLRIYEAAGAFIGIIGAGLIVFSRGEVHNLTTARSEEHKSELQSLMRISYAVFCLKKKSNSPLTGRYFYTTTTTIHPQSHLSLRVLAAS